MKFEWILNSFIWFQSTFTIQLLFEEEEESLWNWIENYLQEKKSENFICKVSGSPKSSDSEFEIFYSPFLLDGASSF